MFYIMYEPYSYTILAWVLTVIFVFIVVIGVMIYKQVNHFTQIILVGIGISLGLLMIIASTLIDKKLDISMKHYQHITAQYNYDEPNDLIRLSDKLKSMSVMYHNTKHVKETLTETDYYTYLIYMPNSLLQYVTKESLYIPFTHVKIGTAYTLTR